MTDEIISLLNRPEHDGVIHLENHPEPYFSELYGKMRKSENRIYTDEQLKALPALERSHPHFAEWQKRSASAQRLCDYLIEHPYNSLLDFGCGNGWLTHKIAGLNDATVLGLDLHIMELKQAAHVFKRPNLKFMYGTNYNLDINHLEFDIILMSSSIQYIKNPRELLQNLWRILADNGEIHIIDTPFYDLDEVADAKQRSSDYFREIGYHEMTRFYYHHSYESLGAIEYDVLYDPLSDWKKVLNLFSIQSPFPWIRVKKAT